MLPAIGCPATKFGGGTGDAAELTEGCGVELVDVLKPSNRPNPWMIGEVAPNANVPRTDCRYGLKVAVSEIGSPWKSE